jgi:hypothetical protein
MSGGYFGYKQFRIREIAQEIEELIASNNSTELNRWGEELGRGYNAATIAAFSEAVAQLRIAEAYVQRIDWLVSCDDSEECFHRRLDEDLAKIAGGAT